MRHGQHFRRWIRHFVRAVHAAGALSLLFVTGCSPGAPAHGTAFLVALKTNAVDNIDPNSNHLLHVRDVLRKRLDTLGPNFSIEPVAQERLLIKLPNMGSNDLETARKLISKPGLLEFRIVHTNSTRLMEQGIVEPGYEVLKEEVTLPGGTREAAMWLVRKSPERGLTGKYIRRAAVHRDPVTKAPQISFEFDQTGARLFEQVTTDYRPAGDQLFQLAIVLDGELQAVPRIMSPISGGRGMISGKFTVREAMALAASIENPVEMPLVILEEKTF